MELQIEFQFLSELEKAPNLILQKDTIDFNNYYIVVHHTKPQDSRLTYINVDLHTTRNFLIGRYHFIRENEETDKP